MGDWMRAPKWLKDVLPEAAGSVLDNGGWLALLALLGIILLLVLLRVVRGLLAGAASGRGDGKNELEEDLTALPPAPPPSGDKRLLVEGVPVRLRLVVVAPAGSAYDIKPDVIPKLLERVVPGLGDLCERDRPVTRFWPHQLSYEGFANTFHRNTPLPEGEKQPSRWVLVAGRADLGGRQVLVGLGLEAVKPTTVFRKTLQPHEWATTLRVRVKEP